MKLWDATSHIWWLYVRGTPQWGVPTDLRLCPSPSGTEEQEQCLLSAIFCSILVISFFDNLFPPCNLQIPASSPLLTLVAVDWFHSDERIDNVAARPGCLMQVGTFKLP